MAEVLANAQAPAETPEERQARIEKLVARHEAPVIPRYLKPVAAAVETPVSAGNSGPKPSSDAPPPKQDGKQGKRGKGGKVRRRVHKGVALLSQQCACGSAAQAGQQARAPVHERDSPRQVPDLAACPQRGRALALPSMLLLVYVLQQQDDGSSLCINLVKGECKFGDKCRWNHDVQRYLTLREPDLPGTCPFTNAASCPYGRPHGTHLRMCDSQR